MDAWKNWMIIHFTPYQTMHHSTKMDVLPKTLIQIRLAAKWQGRAFKYTSPKQQRRPWPALLSLSFFYGKNYSIPVEHHIQRELSHLQKFPNTMQKTKIKLGQLQEQGKAKLASGVEFLINILVLAFSQRRVRPQRRGSLRAHQTAEAVDQGSNSEYFSVKKPDGKAGALCYTVKSQDRERERNIPKIG